MSELISMPRNRCCTVNPTWTAKAHLLQSLNYPELSGFEATETRLNTSIQPDTV